MVQTAPIPATIAKFRQLTLFIEDVTRKEVQYRIKKKTTYAKSKTLLTSTSQLYASFTITAFDEKSTIQKTPIPAPTQNCFFACIKRIQIDIFSSTGIKYKNYVAQDLIKKY